MISRLTCPRPCLCLLSSYSCSISCIYRWWSSSILAEVGLTFWLTWIGLPTKYVWLDVSLLLTTMIDRSIYLTNSDYRMSDRHVSNKQSTVGNSIGYHIKTSTSFIKFIFTKWNNRHNECSSKEKQIREKNNRLSSLTHIAMLIERNLVFVWCKISLYHSVWHAFQVHRLEQLLTHFPDCTDRWEDIHNFLSTHSMRLYQYDTNIFT